MVTNFYVKRLLLKDLSSFVILWNQDYQLLTSSGFLMTKEKAKEGFEKKMFDYYGLYKKNQLIGFLLLQEDNDLLIKHLLIDKTLRRKGLGTLLLRKAQILSKKKKKNLKTEVLKDNQIALNFFLKNGFKVIDFNKKQNHYILIKTGK